MNKQKKINSGGLQGTGKDSIDRKSPAFQQLQEAIQQHSGRQKKSEKVSNQLLSLRFQMMNYLESDAPSEVKPAGYFLEKYLEVLVIKKKTLARYLGYQESNLSAILKGKRSINTDLAIKLGEIFQLDPELWLNIQSKNTLIEVARKNKAQYQHYSLQGLLNEG